MENKLKDAYIQVKIDGQSKEDFFEKCKQEAINPSAWLRKKIYEFIKKD